jgi:hypothetical protein
MVAGQGHRIAVQSVEISDAHRIGLAFSGAVQWHICQLSIDDFGFDRIVCGRRRVWRNGFSASLPLAFYA